MKETKRWLWDHCGGQKTTTKVVVLGGDLLMQGKELPCSLLWRAVGPSVKFAKMKQMWDFQDELGGYNISKAQSMNPYIKIKTNL